MFDVWSVFFEILAARRPPDPPKKDPNDMGDLHQAQFAPIETHGSPNHPKSRQKPSKPFQNSPKPPQEPPVEWFWVDFGLVFVVLVWSCFGGVSIRARTSPSGAPSRPQGIVFPKRLQVIMC
jgi:hypothetical protein